MSDSRFDRIYDPVATPNPACDDDFEPASAGSPAAAFDHHGLAQTILHRAHARQEAIADAFVDALLAGKTQLFRILLELEKAAATAEAQAEDSRRPGLADILLPMLQRERAQAAANAAQNEAENQTQNQTQNDPAQPHQSPGHIHALSAPAHSQSEEPASPQPGITDIQATADRPCRSQTVAHHRQRAKSPRATRTVAPACHPEIRDSIRPPAARPSHSTRHPSPIPFTLLILHAVAASPDEDAIRIPIRLKSYGRPHPIRPRAPRNSHKQSSLQV